MLELRINPMVVKDLKSIRDYIAEDNEEYATRTIKEIYDKMHFTELSGRHSVLERPLSEVNGRLFFS